MKKVYFTVRTAVKGIISNKQLGENYTKVNVLQMENDSWVAKVLNEYIENNPDSCDSPTTTAIALNFFSDIILIPGGEEENPENWISFCSNDEVENVYVVASNGDTYERITAKALTPEQIEHIICHIG